MIENIKAGERITQAVLLRLQKVGNSSNGGVFARGTVEDNSGSMPFISFEQRIVDKLRSPDRTKSSVYLVTGKVDLSKYARDSLGMQIVIEKLEDLRSDDDISMLIPRGNFNLEQYKEQIVELESLLDAQLRQLPNSNEVANLLDDISFIAQDNGLAGHIKITEFEVETWKRKGHDFVTRVYELGKKNRYLIGEMPSTTKPNAKHMHKDVCEAIELCGKRYPEKLNEKKKGIHPHRSTNELQR